METLKFRDQTENNIAIKVNKFKDDMKRDQKAIALTLMNHDRRQHMTSANDKLRSKLAREKLSIFGETGGERVPHVMNRQHLEKHAYAPDMVNWNKREMKKLLAVKKNPEEN